MEPNDNTKNETHNAISLHESQQRKALKHQTFLSTSIWSSLFRTNKISIISLITNTTLGLHLQSTQTGQASDRKRCRQKCSHMEFHNSTFTLFSAATFQLSRTGTPRNFSCNYRVLHIWSARNIKVSVRRHSVAWQQVWHGQRACPGTVLFSAHPSVHVNSIPQQRQQYISVQTIAAHHHRSRLLTAFTREKALSITS